MTRGDAGTSDAGTSDAGTSDAGTTDARTNDARIGGTAGIGTTGRADPSGQGNSDDGSASLEFITAGMILLVPLVYLILAMSVVQGGALAVEGAARQAARVYVQAPDDAAGRVRAARAVEFSLADYDIPPGDADVQIDCESAATGCLTRQAHVTVTIRITVALPLVPDVLSLQNAVSIPLQASATQTVSRFWGAG